MADLNLNPTNYKNPQAVMAKEDHDRMVAL